MIGTEVGGRELDNALERFVVMNIEEMARPATEWEAKVLQQVLLLPQVTVTRPPEHELLNAGMTPHDCHANCASQEANDLQKEYRHVSGWYLNGSDLILHSVVEALGHWYCLTPQHISAPPRFQFIPDPLIEWTVDAASGTHEAFRDGVKLPLALRRFPEDHILMRDKFLALVAAGVSVLDARQEVEATLGAEIKTRRRSEGAA